MTTDTSVPATAPGAARRALLRERTFRYFWSAATVSFLGDQVSVIALPLVAVLALDADASSMGLLVAAGVVPNLLFSVVAGAWVDRHGRRRHVMIGADLVRFGAIATVPLAFAFGVLGLPQLYVVAFVVGTAEVLFLVAHSTLFISIVPRERYVDGQSLLYGSRAMSFVLGQSVGGVLVAALTAPVAVLADALSFLASGALLSRIRPVEPPVAEHEPGHLLAGIRWMLRDAIVRAALGATATVNLFTFGFSALFVLYATRALGVTPLALGFVLGAGAVGGIVGATVTSRLARRIGVGPAFVVGCVLFPVPLLFVPLAGGAQPVVLAALFAAEFGSGLGVMILDISIGALFAAVIPDALRARVTGAYMLVNFGVRPIGALAGGVLGSTLGLRPTLVLCVVGASCSVLWLVRSPLPHLRTLPAAE